MMKRKIIIAGIEIELLMISIIAFSFLISTPLVDASSISYCCQETVDGNKCQNTNQENCNPEFQMTPVPCQDTFYCLSGCCINTIGQCVKNTPKNLCENYWYPDSQCRINECKRGCCIIGSEAFFTEELNCEYETKLFGLKTDFRQDISNELQCILATQTEVEGACIYYLDDLIDTQKYCKYITYSQCESQNGDANDFYANKFCSDAELNTICTSHNSTGCIDGQEDVYWFDSCGNPEEIYNDCSVIRNTKCGIYREGIDNKPSIGGHTCRDLSCHVIINGNNEIMSHGESWCEYENTVGQGRDPVGSRHYRHMCYFGEEIIEECEDYRNQLCVGNITTRQDGSRFSEAYCRANRWRDCYAYNNDKPNMDKLCNENPDCYVHEINVDKDFRFNMCVPNYPPGFDISSDDPSRNGEVECGMATQTCVAIYVKDSAGKYNCEYNCDCEKTKFTQEMNDFCKSLGDCGGYINYIGKYTDAGYTSQAGRIDGNQYVQNKNPTPWTKPADPGSFGASGILGIPGDLGIPEMDSGNKYGMIGAGVGAASMLNGLGATTTQVAAGSGQSISVAYGSTTTFSSGSVTVAGPTMSPITLTASPSSPISLVGGKDGAMTLTQGADSFGVSSATAGEGGAQGASQTSGALPPGAANALAAVGFALSAQAFFAGFGMDEGASWGASIATTLLLLFLCPPCLGPVGLLLGLYMMIMGVGDTKEVPVKFVCAPWQPPFGGDDCKLCNKSRCSEYKCNSLGQTCEYINPRTDQAECVNNNPYDVTAPKISPNQEVLSEGQKYEVIGNNGFEILTQDDECIEAYSPVTIGIKVDKPSQCRFSYNLTSDFEDMDYFAGGLFSSNHTKTIVMPNPSAFKNQYNLTDEQIEILGKMEIYLKCQSINGITNTAPYIIKTCVNPGPDLTAPLIQKVYPPPESYIAYGQNQKNITIYVNEPSSCRYSLEDLDYDDMENQMTCRTGLFEYSIHGWPCFATVNTSQESQFYIKCKDQPWLAEENESRNPMKESYFYSLILSEGNLTISGTNPFDGQEIVSSFEPVTIKMELETTNGAQEGKSNCSWKSASYSDRFTSTNSNTHSYSLLPFYRGNHEIRFNCQDIAGNTVNKTIKFRIYVDESGPIIIRHYKENSLKIITNEAGECRYTLNKQFDWGNSTKMDSIGKIHSTPWELGTYYIQCEDDFKNKGSAIKIKTFNSIGGYIDL